MSQGVQISQTISLDPSVSIPKNSPQRKLPSKEAYDSEFLELDEAMKNKLQQIEKHHQVTAKADLETNKVKEGSSSTITKPAKSNQQKKNLKHKLNKSLDFSTHLPHPKHSKSQDRLSLKAEESQIKREYLHKMKEWQREKDELAHKRQALEEYKKKMKEQKDDKRKREQQEEDQFNKLQKKKLLEQKISEIQERRKQREKIIKNVPKRQKNPIFEDYQQKFKAKQEQQALLDLKLIRNKKQKMMLDPEVLRAHEQAYIQRIKERLNMNAGKQSRSPAQENRSEFVLYLKRNEEVRKAEIEKMARMRKFQEKINRVHIKIDQEKKKEVLISKDKARHPQKYHILSQKALNDEQIYQEFKGLDIELDAKKKGNDYLQELKNQVKQTRRTKQDNHTINRNLEVSQSTQKNQTNRTRSLPKITNKSIKEAPRSNPEKGSQYLKTPFVEKGAQKGPSVPSVSAALQVRSEGKRPAKSRSFSQLSSSQSYERTLQKAKERDSLYINALRQKLVGLD